MQITPYVRAMRARQRARVFSVVCIVAAFVLMAAAIGGLLFEVLS